MLRPSRPADDVLRAELSSRPGRWVGYTVSVYVYRGVLIDTGFHAVRRSVARLLDEVRPRGAFVTHQHEDHAGNVELLARRGIPLAMSAATEAAVRRVAPIGLYRRVVWQPMPALASAIVPFAPEELRLVETPGHSPDHHVVWDESTRTLFSGDLYLGVKVRIMHSAEDPWRIVESLRAAAALEPARMFCAHRGPVADPVAMLRAKAEWLEETIGEIERRVDAGWEDDARIARAVLGREDLTGLVSQGEYSRRNVVRAVRRGRKGERRG